MTRLNDTKCKLWPWSLIAKSIAAVGGIIFEIRLSWLVISVNLADSVCVVLGRPKLRVSSSFRPFTAQNATPAVSKVHAKRNLILFSKFKAPAHCH